MDDIVANSNEKYKWHSVGDKTYPVVPFKNVLFHSSNGAIANGYYNSKTNKWYIHNGLSFAPGDDSVVMYWTEIPEYSENITNK